MRSNGPLGAALARSLAAARLPDSDEAGASLARIYAGVLDDARAAQDVKTLALLGPKYTALLTAMGLTAAGRGGAAPGREEPKDGPDPVADELAELRERRHRDAR